MDGLKVDRRTAIRRLAAAGAGIASAPLWVETLAALARAQAPHAHQAVQAAGTAWTPKVLSATQNDTVAILCEHIIPATDTPGARETLVNRFIDSVLQEASPSDRDAFLKGLAWMDARSTALFGKPVLASAPADQVALLTRLSSANNASGEEPAGVEFFNALKSMTITGYYTTEVGLRQELGDDGRMVLAAYPGCTHPEHQ